MIHGWSRIRDLGKKLIKRKRENSFRKFHHESDAEWECERAGAGCPGAPGDGCPATSHEGKFGRRATVCVPFYMTPPWNRLDVLWFHRLTYDDVLTVLDAKWCTVPLRREEVNYSIHNPLEEKPQVRNVCVFQETAVMRFRSPLAFILIYSLLFVNQIIFS